MNSIIARYECISLLPELQGYLTTVMSVASIPEHVERVALNFRHNAYRPNKTGPHPIEVHLFREPSSEVWKVATMTSFAFPSKTCNELDVELYFNFNHQWFYQPDIELCDLNQPEVIDLFQSWQRSLVKAFRNGDFDSFAATAI